MAERGREDDLPTDAGVSIAGPVAHGRDENLGQTIAAYRVEALIGSGGMGVVYRAVHEHLRRVVALKLLSPELARLGEFRERFVRESRLAASLQHPHIVTIYDAGESDGRLYIAMQYVQGSDLQRVVADGRLEPERAVAIVEQVAAALDAAHGRGLVHRDVKPANVLLEGEHCYLTDFGLTKVAAEESVLTGRGDFVGTLDYLAPEQIENVDVDARADIYALGCLLYHCLSGTRPFGSMGSDLKLIHAHLHEPPPSLPPEVAARYPGLDEVVKRAMAKDRADRHASAGELAAAARTAVGGGPPAIEQPAGRTAKTVLVAASDRASAASIRAALAGESFEILATVEDEQAAAESLRDAGPDLVVLDSSFGRPAAEQMLTMLPRDSRPPVLALIEEDQEALPGSDAQMAKPFSALQLVAWATRLVEGVDEG